MAENGIVQLLPRFIEPLNISIVEQDDRTCVDAALRTSSAGAFERSVAARVDEHFVRAHLDLLGRYVDERVVLDDGCGPGVFLHALAARAAAYVGLDLSTDALATAAEVARHGSRRTSPVTLVRGSALALPFEAGSFDVVVSSEVLEHVPDPLLHLSEIARVLRPGGRATVSTPSGWLQWFPYPRNVARLVLRPRSARRALFPESRWRDALPHHPALRTSVLRSWCREAGLVPRSERFTQWNFWSHTRLLYRALQILQRCGVPTATVGVRLLDLGEKALQHVGPMRVFAARQILLVEKQG